jgi:hypothetical protein
LFTRFSKWTPYSFSVLELLLKPKIVAVDFEVAILVHNAVLISWPEVRLMGCRFHLGQAWFRAIQKFGLATKYKDPEDEAGKWMRYLFGLPYLDPEEVGDCFAFDFGASQPTDNRITQLADYLVEHYIHENAKFLPWIWAESSSSVDHTTNACESFHSRFNCRFYVTHPPLFIFLEVLKNFQTRYLHKNTKLSRFKK